MFINNPNQSNNLTQGTFSPVSRTTTNWGTIVNYSLNPNTNITASNNNIIQSGVHPFSQHQWTNWNTNWNNNINPNWNNTWNNQVLAHAGNFISGAMIQPSVDISETSSDVVVAAHVSNINVSDINISATENSVTITATGWLGNQNISLNRTVALPTSIRAEAVDASLQSGILEIKCPKAERVHRNRVIVKADQIDRTNDTTIVE